MRGKGGQPTAETLCRQPPRPRESTSPRSRSTTGPLKIGGASLDVTTPEPLPEGHALWTLPNTIISPHCSAYSVHYFELAADLLKVNVERLRAGKGGFNAWKGKSEE